MIPLTRRNLLAGAPSLLAVGQLNATSSPDANFGVISLGRRRELFVDHYLLEKLSGASLVLEHPRDEGLAFAFDKAWEGPFSAYVTMIQERERVRAYYRGNPVAGKDGSNTE